ncbi:MAG: carbohydrate ABC transporter permease [Thermomicrobiales bacterium]|nr:carbohydrate ABC transporter permease [Thermomicrobiales bacterium]
MRATVIRIGLALLAIWTLTPLLWLALLSLTEPIALLHPTIPLLAGPFTLGNYAWLMDSASAQAHAVRAGFANSLIVAVAVSTLSILLGAPAAFGVLRGGRRLRGSFLVGSLVSRAVPPIALAVPFFWFFAQRDLLGARVGLTAAYLGLAAPLAVWMLVAAFAGVPAELIAAARVDGATRWQAFLRVALPLAAPGIGAAWIVAFVGCWNEFTLAQFLVAASPAQTFPVAVAPMLGSMPNQLSAASLVGILPAAVLALLAQRRLRDFVRPL